MSPAVTEEPTLRGFRKAELGTEGKLAADLQSRNLSVNVADSHNNALSDRAAMRLRVIEAGGDDEIRVFVMMPVHGEPLHRMSLRRHWDKIDDLPFDDLKVT